MALTQAQKTLIAKVQASGGGELGTGLSDEACNYVVANIIRDLNLRECFPNIDFNFPEFFDENDPRSLEITGLNFFNTIDQLISLNPDADTYFSCLSTLQKTRLKYFKILKCQPLPTMDQVGPRALLQYGQMSSRMLAGFLLWRKWLFDIDNRAGQETGYLFEPIIANAIGGTPVSAKKSPIRRTEDINKGRQVDCIMDKCAYEFKIRVTIAASGQGRWKEEIDFPLDAKNSGYKPILVVLDPTLNPKLEELIKAYESQDGASYIGEDAWSHLRSTAGETMGLFLDKYVRQPLANVIESSPENLPDIAFKMTDTAFSIELEKSIITYPREPSVNGKNCQHTQFKFDV